MVLKVRSDSNSVLEDASVSGSVLLNDTDAVSVRWVKFGTQSIQVTASGTTIKGTYGTLTIFPNGTYTYTASETASQSLASGVTASEKFSYTAVDANGKTASTTITFTITGVNDAPVVSAPVLSTVTEGSGAVSVNLLLNASDIDTGDTSKLTVTELSALPTGFSLSADGKSIVVDTSNAIFNSLAQGQQENYTFTYKVRDPGGLSVNQSATITVTGTNDAPVVSGPVQGAATEGGATVTINLLQNASDPDSGETATLSVSNVTGLGSGLSLSADGKSLIVDPTNSAYNHLAAGEQTQVTVNYRVTDVRGAFVNQSAVVTITGTNDDPTAQADSYSGAGTITVAAASGVLANDTDVDGDPLTAVLLTGPTNGTLALASDGSFTYTANSGYSGTDSFTYRAFDGTTYSSAQTVTILLDVPNVAPIADNDSYDVATSTPLTVSAANGVLANDGDNDGDPITAVLSTGPSNGTVTLNADGSFTYTPLAGFTGTDSFTYRDFDGKAYSAPATVTFTVATPNAAPVAAADNFDMTSGGTLTVAAASGVLANDTDADGNPLQAVLSQGPGQGTLTLNADGSFTYKPNAGFLGTDSFEYRAFDGSKYSAPTVVSIDVSTTPTQVSTSFQQGVNGYTSTIDTSLLQLSPNSTTARTATTLQVDSGTTDSAQTLLAFDNLFGTGPGQIPVGATIISAQLVLETTNGFSAGTGKSTGMYLMVSDWSDTATWNSMVSGVQTNGVEASSTPVLSFTGAAIGSTTLDVTSSVQSWASAGTTATAANAANNGWLFTSTSSDGWIFNSSEAGATAPKLLVTYISGSSALPGISVGDATATEGSGNTISFKIQLDNAPVNNVTVNYSFEEGTATFANDLIGSTSGSFQILAGQTSYTLTLQLKDNGFAEVNENFTLKIDSVVNGFIVDGEGKGTIIDDDVPTLTPSVVKVTDLLSAPYKAADAMGFGVSDPSGLAYVPGIGLMIADSEHEERPFYSTTNLFVLGTNGAVTGYSLLSYTPEPTGLGYNSANGYVYVADDDNLEVFWVNPSNPTVKLGSFDTAAFGSIDAEDLKYDPTTGHLFMLDGSEKLMYELTVNGQLVKTMALPSVMQDAEALAYDSTRGIFYVGSGKSPVIWALDKDMNILTTINVLNQAQYVNPITGVMPVLKGMELAPSSDPNDGSQLSLYVADYGLDQVSDGRLFEINLGSAYLVA